MFCIIVSLGLLDVLLSVLRAQIFKAILVLPHINVLATHAAPPNLSINSTQEEEEEEIVEE